MLFLKTTALICGVGLLLECSAQTPGKATVSGHVHYANGNPVENAVVDFKCFCPLGAVLPPPAHTDKHGSFALVYPALGEGLLTASKESEGFPDTTNALYRGSSPSYVPVHLKGGAVIRGMNLNFALPRPLLKLTVVDKVSRLPVRNARILIGWPDDPNIMFSTIVRTDGTFAMVLPKHPISITVSAPARNVWRYRDQKTGAPLLETSGSPIHISAQLEASFIQPQ